MSGAVSMGEMLSGERTYFPLPLAYANDRAPIIPSQIRATRGLMALGEILSGERTYFPLPLAYANDRAPIIPSQIRALAPALGELARAARRGLGACPSFAPYESPGGGCSNVPPEVDAFDYFNAGGVLDESSQTIVGYTGAAEPTLDCPFGSKLNPSSGRTECRSQAEALYTTGSGYVVRTSTDPAVMQKIAADAQREGAARGLNITCKMLPLGGDLMNNNQQVYGTDCTVNGNPGQDAALLLTGSGFEIAAVEAGRVAGAPMQYAPQFSPSSGYQYLAPTSQQSPAPMPKTGPVGTVTTTPPPASPPPGSPTKTVGSSAVSKILSDVSTIAGQAQAAAADAGMPSWIWLAGAGAVGFYLLKGKR